MEPGSIVGDKYRVGRVIGRGGMGVIVEATHLQLGTRVAIKILRSDATEKPDVAERFLREARAAAQLKNEHICRVHDYGTLPDHSPFMVMELLEGRDLGSLVDFEGPLDPKLVAEYVIQACAGIAEAHARALIHRDLKPGNLFLELRADGSPCIKILDFGIAKHESDFKLTQTQSVVGSPSYMAPEQLKSSKLVDARTDIWGLGVVMYELLSEQLPFTGDSMPELVLAITTEPPPPLFGGKIPGALIDIVYKCLSKNPDERFQSVGELAEALLPFAETDRKSLVELTAAVLAPKPHSATRAHRVVDELVAAKETTLRTATGALESGASPKTRLAFAIGAIVALLGLGISAWALLRGDGSEPAAVGVPIDAARVNDATIDAPPDAAVDAPIDAVEPDAELTVPVDAPVEIKKKHPHHTPKHSPTEPDLSKSRF
ncbi:MAG TPA: serine/threonine-protein kinase [Kofleriaceae bacterium]|nr:serine/threonine-protein kinase [Kofleriaceae bacterium]